MTRFAIPGSILVGSALVAISLYLGLSHTVAERRDGGDAAAAATAGDPVPRAAPGDRSVAGPSRPGEPQIGFQVGRAEIEAQAKQALEKARPLMLERCWKPAIAASPEPGTSEYLYDVTFDGTTGKAIGRGISEQRDKPSRPDVAQCLRGLPMDYEIAPPGVNTRVEIRLTLP